MNAANVAAAFAALTFLLTLFGVVYLGGKLAKTVEDHGVSIVRHDRQFEDHDKRISSGEREIYGLKKWHDGYDARSSESKKD